MANVKDLLVNGSARVIGTIYGNATSANKVNHSLTFGSKSFNGSSAQTITLADLGGKPTQSAVSSPSVSGTEISFIDTISQNANGVITATKKTVRDASASQSGVVNTGAQTFAGIKTFNNTLNLASINNVAFNFRPGGTGYDTTMSYQTSGNEALVFATKNPVTSFIFVNGEDSVTNHNSDRWRSLTPTLQMKNKSVYINSLIDHGVTPSYNLFVNGTSYLNGTTLLKGKLVVDPSYDTANNSFNEGIRINQASNGWAELTLGGSANSTNNTNTTTWIVARRGQIGNITGAVGDFTIESNSSNGKGLTLHQNYAGATLYTERGSNETSLKILNNKTNTSGFIWAINALSPNTTATTIFKVGAADSACNSGYMGFSYSTAGSATANYLTFGIYAHDKLMNLFGDGNLALGTTIHQNAKLYIQTSSSNSTNNGIVINNGLLSITNYSNTLTIGSSNSSWVHFSSSKPFWFSNSVQINGNLLPYIDGTQLTGTKTLGDSTHRWKSLYIGTADSYGSSTVPVYWNNGVPTAITSYSGNAATATKWSTPRTLSLDSDASGSTLIDGSSNVILNVTNNKMKNFSFISGQCPWVWYTSKVTYTNSSIPTSSWYVKVVLNATWISDFTPLQIEANYSNRAGSLLFILDSYDSYWSGYLTHYVGSNILAIRRAQNPNSSRTEIFIKLAKPIEYLGTTPPGNITVYSPYTIESITPITAEEAGSLYELRRGQNSNAPITTFYGFYGNATSATKLQTARTIALTGSVTGSGTFDGSGNLSIATTTNHNHDSNYVKKTGDTMTGTLNTQIVQPKANATYTLGGASNRWTTLYSTTIDNSGDYIWYGGKNFQLKSSANGQEWSFDQGYSTTSYTGTYSQFWSAKNGVSIIRFYTDDNQVMIPSTGFMGIGGAGDSNYKLKITGKQYIQSNSSASTTNGLTINNGALAISNYNQTLTIGALNESWTHFQTSGAQFYFNKQIHIDGNLTRYNYSGAGYGTISGYNLSGNASTATKLQTARTIWGQSFNGTANITGNLSDVGSDIKLLSGLDRFQFLTSTAAAAWGSFKGLYLSDSYANNTTYKLYVDGTSRFNSTLYFFNSTGNTALSIESRRSKNSSNADIETNTGLVTKDKSFIEIRGFAPPTMVRTTGDRPAPYGLGFGNGSESAGIMPIGEGDNLKELMFYGANSGPTLFTWKYQAWEDKSYDGDYSNGYSAAMMSLNSKTGDLYVKNTIGINGQNTSYNFYVNGSSNITGNLKLDGSITNLAVNGGIYWNPYVESASDPSDAASITVVKSGVAGGTELRISQANDSNDIVNISVPTNDAARINNNIILNAANYTNYTVTKTGSGASGTWGINITGNASSSTNADMVDGYHADRFFIHDRLGATGTNGDDGLWGINGNRSFHNALPDGLSGCYNYGQLISFATDNAARFQIYASHIGSTDNGLYFRTGWGDEKRAWRRFWTQGDAVTGAVWNDYAEYREADTIQGGRCVREVGDDTLVITTKRLMRGCSITSDTWGFAQGETDKAKTPIAVAGRVLAYPLEDRELFREYIGYSVCSGPDGTVSLMTEEEELKYPWAIIGTVSAVPDYEEWGGGEMADRPSVKVDGRIWIKVK